MLQSYNYIQYILYEGYIQRIYTRIFYIVDYQLFVVFLLK